MRDVIERHALEQRLQQARKLEAVGHLAAEIAHEINTSMQCIGDNPALARESVAELLPLVSQLVGVAERGANALLSAMDLSDVASALDNADFDYVREALPKAIARSLDGVSRVAGIVRAMKAFSRPGTGQLEPTDLAARSIVRFSAALPRCCSRCIRCRLLPRISK